MQYYLLNDYVNCCVLFILSVVCNEQFVNNYFYIMLSENYSFSSSLSYAFDSVFNEHLTKQLKESLKT